MKAILFSGALLAFGQTLSTDYEHATRLRIESSAEFSMERTSLSMERDGEPIEGPVGGGGASSKESRRVVQIDEYLERKDGQPMHVRRSFEAIETEGTMELGDRSFDTKRETPLEGVTLDITVDEEGAVAVEVAEGPAPDDELLEGHLPALALDAFLPAGEVAEGDTWEVEADAIPRALGFDVEAALFPPPAPPEDGGGEGRRGGGGRGGFGRGGGGAPTNLFLLGEWKAEAKLESLTEDHEGVICAAIAIEIEGQGELPEGGFGGRRGGFASGPGLRSAGENEFEIQAKGRLLYSLADRRPIYFELEGKIGFERHSEHSNEHGSFVMSSTHEGTFTQTVRISEAKSE